MKDELQLKARLYARCIKILEQKLSNLREAYEQSREDLHSESKSTAGDKHETGRAMIQLEQEKMSFRLQETEKLQNLLQRVRCEKACKMAQSGALVRTTQGSFFIAVGLGSIDMDGEKVFVAAPTSPLIQALLGKKASDSFEFRGKEIKILSVY